MRVIAVILIFFVWIQNSLAEEKVVKYGSLRIPTAVLVGIEKGFFESEGIKVEPVFFKSGAEIAPAVATGQVDVAATTSGAPLFNALARGIDVKIVADALTLLPGAPGGDPTSIVVRKDLMTDGTNDPRTLKGKKVGITAPGQILDMIVRKYMLDGGLSTDQYELVSMPMPDMLVAMENSAIDAAIMLDPFTTFAEQRGIGQVLAKGSEIVPGIQQAFILYSKRMTENERPVGQAFMNGYHKTNSWMREALTTPEGKKEVAAIYQKYIPSRNESLYEKIALSTAVANLSVNVTGAYGLTWQIDHLKTRGLLRGEPKIEQSVDFSFIESF